MMERYSVRVVMESIGLTADAAHFVAAAVRLGTVQLPPKAEAAILEYLDLVAPVGSAARQPLAQECFLIVHGAVQHQLAAGPSVVPEAWMALGRMGLLDATENAFFVATLLAQAAARYEAEDQSAADGTYLH